MKSAFSTSWKSSSQRRKQRKYSYNAPAHIRGKFLSAHVSKELQAKTKTKSLRVRVGDKVKILRGQFKGTIGAIEAVNVSSTQIFVAKAETVKKDGSKSAYPIHPSNVLLIDMKADKMRITQ